MRVGRVLELCLLCLETFVLRQALAGDVHLEGRREGPVGADVAYEVGGQSFRLDKLEKGELGGDVARHDLCGDATPVRERDASCAAARMVDPDDLGIGADDYALLQPVAGDR